MKLSIIIPVYKKPKSLERLIKSCHLCVNLKRTEIILVVDDGTDEQELQELYPKCAVTVCGNNTGAIMAIWKGFLVSSGTYVGCIGDDCEITTPDTDMEIISALNQHPERIVGLNDGIQAGRAHPFMSRKFWLAGGGFPPCYRHYYGDTEIFKTARYHGDWHYLENVKVKHHHAYAEKKGYDVNIIEETTGDCKNVAVGDGEIHTRRMTWWEENNKPRTIPWNI